MIKAIVFDFVQTLGSAADGYKKAEKNSQEKLYEKLGGTSVVNWDKYKELYRQERKEHFLRSDFSRRNVWIAICSRFNISCDIDFFDMLENQYWTIVKESMKLFPETLPVLEKLGKKYKLGLVTNSQKDGSTQALDNEEYQKLEKHFDAIIISGENNIPAKPDPVPFNMIIDALGVLPEEALFVGDDMRVDIEGSKSVGMTPIWLKHSSVERNWPSPSFEVIEITKLDMLLDLEKLLS